DTDIKQACEWLAGRPHPAPCHLEMLQREQPQRAISLSPYLMDIHEVTNERMVDWLNRLRQAGRICVRDWPQDGQVHIFFGAGCRDGQPSRDDILLLEAARD